ncbi:MAG: nucleotidyltransferase domain-containing protein [Synergistaceae bacterium]|nr:nucleotidyltransferase domain-containing protein [Synergistaceae bacterium]
MNIPKRISFEEDKKIFDDIVETILSVLGDDVVKIILYGSVARGDNTWESDVDIAVLTKIKIDKETRHKLSKAAWDLGMKLDVLFSVVAIEINHFNEWLFALPFYFNIDEEGIVLWTREAA